jgi:hypothetical protein
MPTGEESHDKKGGDATATVGKNLGVLGTMERKEQYQKPDSK